MSPRLTRPPRVLPLKKRKEGALGLKHRSYRMAKRSLGPGQGRGYDLVTMPGCRRAFFFFLNSIQAQPGLRVCQSRALTSQSGESFSPWRGGLRRWAQESQLGGELGTRAGRKRVPAGVTTRVGSRARGARPHGAGELEPGVSSGSARPPASPRPPGSRFPPLRVTCK